MSIYTCMDSVCEIQRPTIGRDQVSGVTQNPWRTIANTRRRPLACSYQEKNADARDLYSQRNTFVSSMAYFAQNPGTEVNDRLIVTNLRTGTVVRLLVKGEAQPVARGIQWEVNVERIRQPSAVDVQ